MSYARPDEIGLVDFDSNQQVPLKKFSPLQTFGDWAWIPGISWSPGNDLLYNVDHVPPAESQQYDLEILPVTGGGQIVLASEVGMFSYPLPSPEFRLADQERAHMVAFLAARFPHQSETSSYDLVRMDRDGSNKRVLFPPEGSEGLQPQDLSWSPEGLSEPWTFAIGVIYQGNLWIVDSQIGEAWQITGDGLTSRVDWK